MSIETLATVGYGEMYPARRLAVITSSGGLAELILDVAAEIGIEAPAGLAGNVAILSHSGGLCVDALPAGWLCPSLPLAVVASSGDGKFNLNLGGLETARQAGCGLNPRNPYFLYHRLRDLTFAERRRQRRGCGGSRHPPDHNCKQSARQRGRGPGQLPSIC